MVKVQEIVKGQKDKEVAELRAQQELEVAKLMALAADQKRLALIRESQGEAEGKRLKREADNYEALKIQAAVDIHKAWAGAYSNRRVPLVMGAEDARSGEGGSGIPAQKGVIDLLILKALGLNINLDQRSVDRPAAAPSTHAPAATPPPQPAASRPR
jgi:hypothetical protein